MFKFFQKSKTAPRGVLMKISEKSKTSLRKMEFTADTLSEKIKKAWCWLTKTVKLLIFTPLYILFYPVNLLWRWLRSVWEANPHFTFWIIPANGQYVSKKHIGRGQLMLSLGAAIAVFVAIFGGFGYMVHETILAQEQKEEIAAYNETKRAQEATIEQLQQMAEKNQKELAQLSELEEQIRQQLAKSGATLPPRTNVATAQGGSAEAPSKLKIIAAQEETIAIDTQAKKADWQKLLETIKQENYRREVTPSIWPTDGGTISSEFGYRRDPFGNGGSDYHPGIDIAVYYGAPVYATASGYVAEAGWIEGYGRYIRVVHDFGYETAYAHMSSLGVASGSFVSKGDIIGRVGSSGYSTGPHLHYEVIYNSKKMQPLDYVK